jgi:hypothetical protein
MERSQNMSALKYSMILSLMVVAALLMPSEAQCTWPVDGAGVCVADSLQAGARVCEGEAGNSIVVWVDRRTGVNDIYAQQLDPHGHPVWAANGIPICTASGSQTSPEIASDGAGGAIIVWNDQRGADYDIYAQRVDAGGVARWAANGIALCTAVDDQVEPRLAADGSGGAFVVWEDNRAEALSMSDIYAQRVESDGNALWVADGVLLCDDALQQLVPEVVPDGLGGAVVTWADYRDGTGVPDVFSQRVNGSGVTQWTYNGVPIVQQSGSQFAGRTVPREGGAIYVWEDYRGADLDIYAQRVDASGNIQWTLNGVALCTASGTQTRPATLDDGAGGVYVFWSDDRAGYKDIYGQRIDSNGSAYWTADGLLVSTSSWDKDWLQVVSDGVGGAILAWDDMGDGVGNVIAQRVGEDGTAKWESPGVPLCVADGLQMGVKLISDGAGGAIASWSDKRTGDWDVYAQRVTRQGYWGYPCPWIISAEDISPDQGGRVWLAFERSRLDIWQEPRILDYSIWRSIGLGEEEAGKSYDLVLSSPAEARPEMVGEAAYFSSAGGWALVGTTSALQLTEYGYVVPTVRDSTGEDPALEYYFVSAHASGAADHWESAVVPGYSVDNLAPCMPVGPAASYSGVNELWIHWNPNTEADLSRYAVYRGANESFVPNQTNLVGASTDTTLTDEDTGGVQYYYKISAFDVHGNEGPHALLTPDMITGTPDTDRRHGNVLFQNAPNPFTSSTSIAFSVEKEGPVRLSVFDAKGRLVRVLVDEIRAPRRYAEKWDGRDGSGRKVPAGAYFYRLETPGWSAVKKMTTAG